MTLPLYYVYVGETKYAIQGDRVTRFLPESNTWWPIGEEAPAILEIQRLRGNIARSHAEESTAKDNACRLHAEVEHLRAEVERLKNPPLPEGWVRYRRYIGRFDLDGNDGLEAYSESPRLDIYTHGAYVTFDLPPVQKPPEVTGRTETKPQ